METPQMPWDGRRPSETDCVRACLENAEQAAKLQSHWRQRYEAARDSEEAMPAWNMFFRYRAEQLHWRRLASWYRERALTASEAHETAQAELGGGLR